MRRVGATQGSLIEPGPSSYPQTAASGKAAFDAGFDGIVWMSRQFPGGLAAIVFARADEPLRVDGTTLLLASGKGFDYVSQAANAAAIVIVDP
jgi:hypothetical protein